MDNFFIKFIRELNSADSSKSIVLAVVLGLIAGFLPTVNFFTVLIFFMVLILRIPIGLFIASFSAFKIIGFFLDSVFNKVGFSLLTSGFLKPFWTFLYNIPFFRWSGFNNTVVMGSLVLGVVFGIILYILLSKSINLYRRIVFEKLREIKVFAWLVPQEKKGIIRISGILALVFIVTVVSLFFIFLLDPIIKYSLEFTFSKIFHKKVAIESVDTSLKNLSVNIKNMQIGDVLFERVHSKLDWNKIVWRKYKIDDLEIFMSTNKNIYSLIKSYNRAKNTKNNNFNLNIKLPSPESFLAKQELKSLKALEKLKKDYVKVQKDLKNINTKRYKQELKEIKKELNNLKNIKINNPQDFQNLLAEIKKIKSKTNDLVKKVKSDKNIVIKDKKIISSDLKNLQIALKEDKKNIKSKYEMLKNKEYLQFTESILKPQISKYVKIVSNIYEKIKPYIQSNKENNEKRYIRAGGVYIKFEDKIKYPDFVLVKSNAGLKTSIAKWNIKAKNISDNQMLLARRGDIVFKGKSKFFDVGGDINYLNDVRFNIYANKVKIKKLDLNFVKIKSLADIKVKGDIKNDNINSNILIYFNNPEFITDKRFKDINIKHFKIIISLNGKVYNPKIVIKSDLDKYISKIIENKINSLIQKNSNKTIKMLNNKINNSLKGLKLNNIDLKLNDLNSIENVKELINKQLSNIIKSKKKSLIEDKIRQFF